MASFLFKFEKNYNDALCLSVEENMHRLRLLNPTTVDMNGSTGLRFVTTNQPVERYKAIMIEVPNHARSCTDFGQQ